MSFASSSGSSVKPRTHHPSLWTHQSLSRLRQLWRQCATLGLTLVAVSLLSGCCYSRCVGPLYVYSRVEVSDFECRPVAEYIAQGPIQNVPGGGICIMAVERRVYNPCPITFHYPLGRPVNVVASNIRVTPAAQPVWLTCLDAGL